MSAYRETSEGIEIRLKVVPGASQSRIVGYLGDTLKIQVAAPPERGKANASVEALIATAFGVSKSSVTVVSGTSSPRKVVLVKGITLNQVRGKFG